MPANLWRAERGASLLACRPVRRASARPLPEKKLPLECCPQSSCRRRRPRVDGRSARPRPSPAHRRQGRPHRAPRSSTRRTSGAVESLSSVDCSGLVVAVYRRLGVKLPTSPISCGTRCSTSGRSTRATSSRSARAATRVTSGSSDRPRPGIHAVGAGKGVPDRVAARAPRPPRLSRRGAAEGAATPCAPGERRRLQHPRAVGGRGERVHDRDPQHGAISSRVSVIHPSPLAL